MCSFLTSKQKGSALITALLIVMFTSALLVSLIFRQNIAIKHLQQMVDVTQAYQHALGVEDWAVGRLKDIFKIKNKKFTPSDFPIEFSKVPVQGGNISGSLEDMQAKFNVNLLERINIDNNFKKLVNKLDPNVNAQQLKEMVDTIRSSLVKQTDNGSIIYKMSSISELRTFPNVSAQLFSALSPFLAALPKNTALNINTLSPMVLYAILPNVTDELIREFNLKREQASFNSVSEFWQFVNLMQPTTNPQDNGENTDNNNQQGIQNIPLTLGSEYFLSKSEVHVGKTRLILFSLLRVIKNNQGNIDVKVLWRSRGAL